MDRPALLQAAAAQAAALAGREGEIEALRRLPDDVAEAMSASSLWRALLPQALGGHEADPASFFEAVEALAVADGAVGWCTMIACTASVMSAYLPPASAAALYGRADLRAAGVFAPRGRARAVVQEGRPGYLVSGRWAWGSAVHVAHVVSLGCMEVADDGSLLTQGPGGAPRTLTAVLPRAAVKTLDNWASLGLRGTGSGEIEVSEVFVPADHVVRVPGDAPLPRPLYRFPLFGLLALGIAAVASGRAQRALQEFTALAQRKSSQDSRRLLAERATVQQALAQAQARQRAARAGVLAAVASVWQQALAEAQIGIEARSDLRLACSHAAHEAVAVAERLFSLAGGDAVFDGSALQRAWRDVHVAQQHLMVAEPGFELFGKLLLGLPADTAML